MDGGAFYEQAFHDDFSHAFLSRDVASESLDVENWWSPPAFGDLSGTFNTARSMHCSGPSLSPHHDVSPEQDGSAVMKPLQCRFPEPKSPLSASDNITEDPLRNRETTGLSEATVKDETSTFPHQQRVGCKSTEQDDAVKAGNRLPCHRSGCKKSYTTQWGLKRHDINKHGAAPATMYRCMSRKCDHSTFDSEKEAREHCQACGHEGFEEGVFRTHVAGAKQGASRKQNPTESKGNPKVKEDGIDISSKTKLIRD